MGQSPDQYPLPTLRTVLWRGGCRRCPRCGQGPLYVRWLKLHDCCSHCGLRFLENQGDLWAMLLLVDRFVFIVPVIALLFFWKWHPGLPVFVLMSCVVTFLLIYTVPHRNGMTVGLDYLFRRKNYFTGETDAPDPAAAPSVQNNPCPPSAAPLDSRPHEQDRRH